MMSEYTPEENFKRMAEAKIRTPSETLAVALAEWGTIICAKQPARKYNSQQSTLPYAQSVSTSDFHHTTTNPAGEKNQRPNLANSTSANHFQIESSSMKPNLKPCPFCGNEVYINTELETRNTEHQSTTFAVECFQCDAHPAIRVCGFPENITKSQPLAMSIDEARKLAIKLWNTRKTTEEEQIDQLERQNQKIDQLECRVMNLESVLHDTFDAIKERFPWHS